MFSRGARTIAREFRDGEPPGPLSCRKSGWLAWPTAACCAPSSRSAATRTRSSALTATTARRVLRRLLDAGETGGPYQANRFNLGWQDANAQYGSEFNRLMGGMYGTANDLDLTNRLNSLKWLTAMYS